MELGDNWINGQVTATPEDNLDIELQFANLEREDLLWKLEQLDHREQNLLQKIERSHSGDIAYEDDQKQRFRKRMSTISSSIEFMDAAKSGNASRLETVLKTRVNLNATDENGSTALHWAVRSGDSPCVTLLLNQSLIDINRRDLLGWTPLHYASYMGLKEIVSLLIRHPNIRTNIRNEKGKTPLAVAKSKDIAVLFKFRKVKKVKEKDKKAKEREDFKTYASRASERTSARINQRCAATLDHIALADMSRKGRLVMGNRPRTLPNEALERRPDRFQEEEEEQEENGNTSDYFSIARPSLKHPTAVLPASASSTKRRGRTFLYRTD